jgi:hypothetical protein
MEQLLPGSFGAGENSYIGFLSWKLQKIRAGIYEYL